MRNLVVMAGRLGHIVADSKQQAHLCWLCARITGKYSGRTGGSLYPSSFPQERLAIILSAFCHVVLIPVILT